MIYRLGHCRIHEEICVLSVNVRLSYPREKAIQLASWMAGAGESKKATQIRGKGVLATR